MGRALLLSVVGLVWLTNCKSNDTSSGTGGAGSGAAGMGVIGASGTSAAGGGLGAAAGHAGGAVAAGGSTAGASTAGSTGVAGCGSESFAAIYQSVFANPTYGCNGPVCHGRDASMAATVGSLSMSTAAVAYTQLVNMRSASTLCSGKTRVVPGDPTNSLLVQKLRSGTTICGAPMPVNADELTEQELKRITDWISAGACNN